MYVVAMKIFLKSIGDKGTVYEFDVHPSITANEFIRTVFAPKLNWLHPMHLKLQIGVTGVEGDNSLESYGIKEGSTLSWIHHKNFQPYFLPWPPKDEPQPSSSSVH